VRAGRPSRRARVRARLSTMLNTHVIRPERPSKRPIPEKTAPGSGAWAGWPCNPFGRAPRTRCFAGPSTERLQARPVIPVIRQAGGPGAVQFHRGLI
jgi:hypothetical protein